MNSSNYSYDSPLNSSDPYQIAGLEELPYMATESVASTFLNLFVLIVFIRMRKFTLSNVIFMMLSASDLILGLVAEPLFIVFSLFARWPLGDFMCHVFQIVLMAQMPVSNQIILLMAIHRCLQFTKPFLDHEKFNLRKIIVLSYAWVGSYVYVIGLVIVYRRINTVKKDRCDFEFSFTYVMIHDVLLNIIPSFLAILINLFNIYQLFKRSRNSISFSSSSAITSKTAKMTLAAFGKRHDETGENESTSCNKSNDASSAARVNVLRKFNDCSRAKRDFKAGLCMLFIVINIVVNEYFFNIMWPLAVACPTCYDYLVINWATKNMFMFPVINPIILFLFHDTFKKEAIRLIQSPFKRFNKTKNLT